MKLTHISEKGEAKMVDISKKQATLRIAKATATVKMKRATLKEIITNKIEKGNVLETARIAGISAAKKTSELVPLCHNISISQVSVNFTIKKPNKIVITSEVKGVEKTGFEMEALISCTVSALTIYDMCKSIDRWMTIENVCLIEKSGGKQFR